MEHCWLLSLLLYRVGVTNASDGLNDVRILGMPWTGIDARPVSSVSRPARRTEHSL
jgi:hypothetical protein